MQNLQYSNKKKKLSFCTTTQMDRRTGRFVCDICGYESRNKETFRSHRRQKHGVSISGKKRASPGNAFPCPVEDCDSTYSSANALRKHVRTKHAALPLKISGVNPNYVSVKNHSKIHIIDIDDDNLNETEGSAVTDNETYFLIDDDYENDKMELKQLQTLLDGFIDTASPEDISKAMVYVRPLLELIGDDERPTTMDQYSSIRKQAREFERLQELKRWELERQDLTRRT